MTANVRIIMQAIRDGKIPLVDNDPLLSKLPTYLSGAVKFHFETNALRFSSEQAEADILERGKTSVAPPTREEFLMVAQSELPWPYIMNWFEWSVLGGTVGYLIQPVHMSKLSKLSDADLTDEKLMHVAVNYDGFMVLRIDVDPRRNIVVVPAGSMRVSCQDIRTHVLMENDRLDIDQWYHGRVAPIPWPFDTGDRGQEAYEPDSLRRSFLIVISLLARLYSRSMVVADEVPSPKLVARQLKNGKVPSFEYSKVTLHPLVKKGLAGDGKGGARKLHFVRSFRRTLANGKTIPVVAHWRGAGELGRVNKHYEVLRGLQKRK